MRKKSQSLPSQSIAEIPFTFHFPKNQHIFTLNLPLEIKVRQLTEIVNNFTKLHRMYGEKVQNRVSKPKYLSFSSNIIIDYFLQSKITEECTFTCLLTSKKYSKFLSSGIHFSIVYTSQSISNPEDLQPSYQPLHKLKTTQKKSDLNSEEFIVRSQKNGSLYYLQRRLKKNLKFQDLQQLIILRDSLKKWEKDGLSIAVSIEQTYESENYLNLVTTFLPIRLSDTKINDRQIFETYFSQIARTIYLLYKQGFNPDILTLSDFGLTFNHKVLLSSVLLLKKTQKRKYEKIKIEEESPNYNDTITQLWEQMMRNCEYLIIEYYLPFYHYLKNGKICTYSDFIRYFQLERKQVVTPRNTMFYGMDDATTNQTVLRIIEQAQIPQLIPVSEKEKKQFDKTYKPSTSIFSYHSPTSDSSINPEESELDSTIKKPKPKPKKKSNIDPSNQNKSFKTKKHDRNTSEFLLNK